MKVLKGIILTFTILLTILTCFFNNTISVISEEVNTLQNGSFEDGQTWSGSYKQLDQSAIPNWNTTAYEGKIELLRSNTGTYFSGVTLTPTDGVYAAELNADEESTLYQIINTEPSSIYEWGLDHGARNGTDTMALVIGPSQTNSPSKPNKAGRDQFMQMADYLVDIGLVEENITTTGIYNNGTPIVLYSKPFGIEGSFIDSDNNPFSLVPTEEHTEQWHIWIITDAKGTSNVNPWYSYGLNNSDNSYKYYRYLIPEGQTSTIFGFVSVGYTNSIASAGKEKTYGNFLDGINFKIYHQVNGSSSDHGYGSIISSDNALGESNLIDYTHDLEGYVEEGSSLTVSAKIKIEDIDDVKFIGFNYSYIDEYGNSVTNFVTYDENDENWDISTNDTEVVYKYVLNNVHSAVDIHLVFIKSPTITYDSNGGLPYLCILPDGYEVEGKEDNVYSFMPIVKDDGTMDYINPYTSHEATGQNEKWKFIGWEVYDDNGKVTNLMLNGVHSVAYNYHNYDSEDENNSSTFNILSQGSFTGLELDESNGESINWVSSEDAISVYHNPASGLTMVANWRYKETFIPQTYNGSVYENSNKGGSIEITKTTASDSNSACSFEDGMSYAKCYYAANMEEMTVTATPESGYVFEGWYDESGNLISKSNKYTFSENKGATYYARFTSMVTQSFVRQIEDNGNWTNITDDKIGTLTVYSHTNSIGSVVKSTALETTGYKFIGWYDENGIPVNSSMLTNDGKSITYTTTGNATYYARFEIAYCINYLAQAKQSDGTYKNLSASLNLVPAFLENIAGQTVSATAKNYTGYTFEGWYDASGNPVDRSMLTNNGKTITVTTSSENHNTIYYARYHANDTTLTYNANYADNEGNTATSTVNGKVDEKVVVNDGTLFDRAGYIFIKWNTKADGKGTDYINPSEYKLKASENVLHAIWEAKDNTAYKIEHYKVKYDANGNINIVLADTDNKEGSTDTTVDIDETKDLKDYEGYTYDGSYVGTITSGVITGDGRLVLKLYYVANEVELIYDPNGGSNNTNISESDTIVNGHVDQIVTLQNCNDLFNRYGYDFMGWGITDSTVAYDQGDEYAFTSDEKQTLYAIWEARTDMPYIVEYYYQNSDGTYPEASELTDDDKVIRNDGIINASIKIKDSDKVAKPGYVFDEDNENNILETSITNDGVPVLRLYFKLQFTVTYDLDGGTSTTEQLVYENINYNGDTPLINEPTKSGYNFEGYDSDITDKVTANVTYKALWSAREDMPYKVEYYYQNSDGTYPTSTELSVTRNDGKTLGNVEVNASDKNPAKEGYVFDSTNLNNVLNATISTDSETVLKVYFKLQFTVSYDLDGGTSTTEQLVYDSIDYNGDTPLINEPTKAGYNFEGYDSDIADKVTANVTYKALWSAREDMPYKVEYYYQNGDGTYPTSTEYKNTRNDGITNQKISILDSDKNAKAGYVFDIENTNNILETTVLEDSETVLKLYFKLQFTISYLPGTKGTFTTKEVGSLDYNAVMPAAPTTTCQDGYSFVGWDMDNDGIADILPEKVTSNATYIALWKANENTEYKVEYYYQENGSYPETTSLYAVRTGTTDTVAYVTAEDKIPNKTGYVYDTKAVNVESGNITGNDRLILKLYFKEQFTVTYDLDGGTSATEQLIYENIDYNGDTPLIDEPTKVGYNFEGYDSDIADKVTANVTYKAMWQEKEHISIYYESEDIVKGTVTRESDSDINPETGNPKGSKAIPKAGYEFKNWTILEDDTETIISINNELTAIDLVKDTTGEYVEQTYIAHFEAKTDTAYTVEYYYQENGTYPETTVLKDSRTGTTGTVANVTTEDKVPAKAGYVYDESATNIETGAISGEGDLVLKLYFKQQFTVSYKPGDYGTFEETTIDSLDYGVKTPDAPEITGKAGYEFIGWDIDVADTVTKDSVYVAKWQAKDDIDYEVYHYKVIRSDNGNNYLLEKHEILQGTTDSFVKIDPLAIKGYIFEEDYYEDGMIGKNSGYIEGDGSLVLKLFYVADETTLTYKANGGIGNDVKQTGLVNEELIVKNGTIFKREGYAFAGWNTKADGSGIKYHIYSTYTLTENEDILYAMWIKMDDNYIPPASGIDSK